MADGLLSPDDMMLGNEDVGGYFMTPAAGLLGGMYETMQIPAKVYRGDYGVGSVNNPAFMQAAQDFTIDYGVLPAAGGAIIAPSANTLRMGLGGGKIRAFHGSPHEFAPSVRVRDTQTGKTYVQEAGDPVLQAVMKQSPERYEIIDENPLGMFDISKIGTGEGAQAYGRGAYLSEVEGIARDYRDNLSKPQKLYYLGRDVSSPDMIDDEQSNLILRAFFLGRKEYQDPAEAIEDEIRNLKSRLNSLTEPDAFQKLKAAYKNDPHLSLVYTDDALIKSDMSRDIATIRKEIELLEDVNPDMLEVSGGGHMYEAEILASPDQFLDYDAPIANQPKEIQQRLAKALEVQGRKMGRWRIEPTASGKRFYVIHPGNWVTEGYPNPISKDKAQKIVDAENAKITGAEYIPRTDPEREALLDAGILGVKYKAGGYRREMPEENIKRNFVVFDDAMINILRKYGLLAPIGAGAVLNGSGLLDVDSQGQQVIY